jgi:hypothetical protein
MYKVHLSQYKSQFNTVFRVNGCNTRDTHITLLKPTSVESHDPLLSVISVLYILSRISRLVANNNGF